MSLYKKYVHICIISFKYCNLPVECFYRTNFEPYFMHTRKSVRYQTKDLDLADNI